MKDDVSSSMQMKVKKIREFLLQLSGGKANMICIFGAGTIGLQLYKELFRRLVYVNCFSDNDSQKHGYLINGVRCISVEKLKEYKEDILVIIATQRYVKDIKGQLKELGFPYVTTRQDIGNILQSTPAVRWMNEIEDLENIDYSSREIVGLVECFKKTIFDLSAYYEEKIYLLEQKLSNMKDRSENEMNL